MIILDVNGKMHTLDVSPDTPLLYVLRNDLGLNGPKFGCGLGQCGACTVLMDGTAVLSCLMPVARAAGHKIVTLEGLGSPGKPHPLQRAFIKEQAAQCGYCSNGMIMKSKELLDHSPDPTEEEIRNALASNLCRCGTHNNIIRAVRRAAREMKPRELKPRDMKPGELKR
ncbi:MAG: (2Fe-2S)-binding protein [Steroidobacteraceae bacterium]|nr:(2Fe-2S)-binding protein [Deltaproteobacteria bacterium]